MVVYAYRKVSVLHNCISHFKYICGICFYCGLKPFYKYISYLLVRCALLVLYMYLHGIRWLVTANTAEKAKNRFILSAIRVQHKIEWSEVSPFKCTWFRVHTWLQFIVGGFVNLITTFKVLFWQKINFKVLWHDIISTIFKSYLKGSVINTLYA